MDEFERICKEIEKNGYNSVSIEGATKKTYINDDKTISIVVEFDDHQLSAKDEELIKKRLMELGYL